MDKKEVQKRVLQNGQPLDLKKFEWDEKTKTFTTTENNLVLDFKGIDKINFITGKNCTFKTGDYCKFNTGFSCTFNTGSNCTFNTGFYCTFKTSSYCTFKTGWNCTFNTGHYCKFDTGKKCVIVRRDVFEIIQPEEDVKIKLNDYQIKGFEIIKDTKTITIDGKNIEISDESYENLKKQLLMN